MKEEAQPEARTYGEPAGEMAEAEFMAKGPPGSGSAWRPCGDSDPYDFILQAGGRLSRVQVKSAHRAGEGDVYSFRTHGQGLEAYGPEEIDVLVAYVVPEDAWYLFPVEETLRLRSLKLFPSSRIRRSRFEGIGKHGGYLEDSRG